MARKYGKRRKDPPVKVIGSRGFGLGLNQLTHPSAIKNNELAECFNAVFSQNGIIEKRQGSKNVGSARSGDGYINGLQATYQIDGNDYVLRVGNSGIAQKYNSVTDTYTDISGSPTFSNKRTYILQGYGVVYFMNESDIMAKWNGNTWTEFNILVNPTTAPTVEKQGTGTGARTFYYKYVFYNEIGNTLASEAGNVASMPDALDADTWIKVTIPTPPANVLQVGIFRGVEPGQERYLDKIPVSQSGYQDKGEKFVDETFSVPADNTTSGYHFKIATVFKDSIIGITSEFGDDTLVFSGGLDAFDNFGISSGGGFYSWRKGDGAKVASLQPYKEQLYVFKTNKTGIFDFSTTSGAATMKDLNLAVGGVSQDAIHPAGNDLRGWSQEGAFSMGNEPNFADVVRSHLLSPRIQDTVDSITKTDIAKIASVYYKNLSIWAIPTGDQGAGNTIMVVYDERYVAWSIWTGMKAACFTKFIDHSNNEHLYYGDAISGNIVEMFTGYNDRGIAINWRISTKQFDAGIAYKFKTFTRSYFIFGSLTGLSTRISLVENGSLTRNTYAVYISKSRQGFGNDQWGTMQWGETTIDTENPATSGITVKYADIGSRDLLSLQAQLANNGLNDQVQLMGIFFEYAESEQPLPSTNKLVRL